MRDVGRLLIAWAMNEPGHVRLRDAACWVLTTRIRPLYALRSAWATRHDRPGFRARDY